MQPEEATIIDTKEPVSLTFELRYLNSFTKATPLSNTVTISLSKYEPTMVEYMMAERSYVRFYLFQISKADEDETEPQV